MAKIKLFFLLLIPVISYTQNDFNYTINVLDSFNTSKIGQEGVLHARCIEHGGAIHFSYIMKDTSAVPKLYYAVSGNSGFSGELVASFPKLHNYYPHTSLQIDSLGNPVIYLAYGTQSSEKKVYAFIKNGTNWQSYTIATSQYTPYEQIVSSAPKGSGEIACVFTSASGHSQKGRISYASFDGTAWNVKHLSNDFNRTRTLPSIVERNGKVYVIYGEGLAPDTLITRVHVKENENWSIDYEEKYPVEYPGGSILGHYTKIGEASDGLVFIQSLRNNPNSHPTFMRSNGSGWNKEEIILESALSHSARGQNLMTDNDNTTYWLNQGAYRDARLSWKKRNGEVGFIELPHLHGGILLWDAVLLDDNFYIYYSESNASWPYGNPVTFKELKVSKSSIFTRIDEVNAAEETVGILTSPNPFSDKTRIELNAAKRVNVNLKVYDSKGSLVEVLYSGELAPGKSVEHFKPENVSNSLYYLILEYEGRRTTKKLILQK